MKPSLPGLSAIIAVEARAYSAFGAGEACVGDAEHLVPRLEGDDGRPDRLDHTGKVGAEGEGQRLR